MNLLELLQEAGIDPGRKVASTRGGEFQSSCPACGGTNRFIIHPNDQREKCIGSYWCRRCEIGGDAIQFCKDFLGMSFEEATARVNAVIPNRRSYIPCLPPKRKPPPFVTVEQPPALWMEKAARFVDWAHENIFEQEYQLSWLANRGIPVESVKKYKVGWNPEPFWREKAEWGIEVEKNDVEPSTKLFLPKGIVIPTLDNFGVVRIKIRNTDYDPLNKESKKYQAITGSMRGLNLVGDTKNNVMLVVESEFDTLALDFVCGDFAFAVSVGSNTKNPDNSTNYLALKVAHLLICYDNDDGGLEMWRKWKALYPHAKAYPTPIGKDVGEAFAKGLNLREWISTALYQS